jgi:hypothetical protein
LRLFIDDLSSIGHDPVPEKDDQTSADSDDCRGRVVETLDFVQMLLFKLLHFFKSIVELLLGIRTLLFSLLSQCFSLVGLNRSFLLFFSHNCLLLLGIKLISFQALHELNHFLVFLLQLRLHFS